MNVTSAGLKKSTFFYIALVACLSLTVFVSTLTSPADAARRRYYRVVRYSPPSSSMAIDLHTGRILHSKNANDPRFPASITKVMTLYLLFDAMRDGKISSKTVLKVSAHAAAQSPTKLGLDEGDTISVSDAIGAVVTKSANDAAVVIGEALAGSEEEFARRMTQKARTIGMLNTTFRNASGLPNPEQRTTAQDLIVMGKNILADHPDRTKAFSMHTFTYGGMIYRNHNTMLMTYAGMEGMKTGFTTASGFNLLASAKRGDKRILAVVLGGASPGVRNATMRTVLDTGWNKALTQVAARRDGVLVAQLKTKPQIVAVAAETASPPKSKADVRAAPATSSNAFQLASMKPSVIPISRLKPDRTSSALLFSAMETGLLTPKRSGFQTVASASSDDSTDEPEERRGKDQSATIGRTVASVEPARNETRIAPASRTRGGTSVHYKTKRARAAAIVASAKQVEVDPEPGLVSVALDEVASESEPVQPQKVFVAAAKPDAPKPPAAASVIAAAVAKPQTIAAATVASSKVLDQPGPYHIQVGAFPEREKAEQRLINLKQTLDKTGLKDQAVFIMEVTLANGTTMYRARAGGFANELKAKAACTHLKRDGLECWDIKA